MVRQSDSGTLATRGKYGLLRGAVEALLSAAGAPTRPDEILEFQDVLEFKDSISKSLSTEENYLRPRMEILVDLGIIDRNQDSKPSEFPWIVTDVTRRAAEEWKGLANFAESAGSYLEQRFFTSVSTIFGGDKLIVTNQEQILLAFAESFARIGREFGFTPARTVALEACLLAWEKGIVIELTSMLAVVKESARTDSGRYLHFSGGSRFDDEFLIRVDPELKAELTKQGSKAAAK
jgi:hypothetical protein